jgi:hypothetical protein
MQQSYPLICSGITSTENKFGRPWNGEFAERNDYLLGNFNFSRHIDDDCEIAGVFNGTNDDEWSIHFFWFERGHTYAKREYWAEAWYDYETKDFHCCVRTVWDGNVRVYGPNPGQKYCKPKPRKTLSEFAQLINTYPWDHFTTHRATFNLDAERAKSRGYKAWLKQTEMKTALAMALHERLGAGSGIATLGGDLIAECVEWI